ncbi:hypothetical protein BRPE64_BCDS12060 [Caballeronia insecticola]|uniref:Uncharacterized protein n=1 Tax=Caballeronia insecticola TaxID=758793 RepID=R4X2X1_9BURK|nr:hypothetical protein BRPE64_BCDS12060 [Caballeronia insecticola]
MAARVVAVRNGPLKVPLEEAFPSGFLLSRPGRRRLEFNFRNCTG